MTSEKKHKCPVCGDGFASKYSLTRHLKLVHIWSDQQISQQIQATNLQVSCHVCSYKFQTRIDLINHLNVEHFFQAKIEEEEFRSKQGKFAIIQKGLFIYRLCFVIFFIEFLEWKEKTELKSR